MFSIYNVLCSDEREAVMEHQSLVNERYTLLPRMTTQCVYMCVVPAVTVEEQIVRQLTEKRMKELSSSITDTRREYQ